MGMFKKLFHRKKPEQAGEAAHPGNNSQNSNANVPQPYPYQQPLAHPQQVSSIAKYPC